MILYVLCVQLKDAGFIKKHRIPIIAATYVAILAVGVLLYENLFSLLAIAGAVFENTAGWMKKEKMIRIVTLFAAPCRFTYNIISGAYGSAIGSVLSVVLIVTALIRYSKLKNS